MTPVKGLGMVYFTGSQPVRAPPPLGKGSAMLTESAYRKNWTSQSICRFATEEERTRYWDGDFNRNKEVVEYVKSTCKECPVLQQCDSYALLHAQYGNYGGRTAKERDEWRKRYKTTLMIDLLYDAIENGWLEEGNLASNDDIEEISNLIALRTDRPHLTEVPQKIDPESLVFEDFDWQGFLPPDEDKTHPTSPETVRDLPTNSVSSIQGEPVAQPDWLGTCQDQRGIA